MTYLVERLAELCKHLDHVRQLRPTVTTDRLRSDLSLHNDLLFSLLTICQLVIDISGELSAQRGLPFDDYTQAVRNLGSMNLVTGETLAALERLPGFRNVLVHEYVGLDLDRVVEATSQLDAIETFCEAVRQHLASG